MTTTHASTPSPQCVEYAPAPWLQKPQQAQKTESLNAVHAAIVGRVNVSPKRLTEPAPSRRQLASLLELAAAAPDHGRLRPWRFVQIPQVQRMRLGDAFVSALIERDPSATQEQIESAGEKAHRAPLLLLAIARRGSMGSGIPESECLVSLGAAIQNILIGAYALGFGSGLTSGQSVDSGPLRALFHMSADEFGVCFVNIGTVRELKLGQHPRFDTSQLCTELSA